MTRYLVLVGAILFAVLLVARREGPDERYVQIYSLRQEGDTLNDAGQGREAALKYLEAQKAPKSVQAEFPSWNGNVVGCRISDLSAAPQPLARELPATN